MENAKGDNSEEAPDFGCLESALNIQDFGQDFLVSIYKCKVCSSPAKTCEVARNFPPGTGVILRCGKRNCTTWFACLVCQRRVDKRRIKPHFTAKGHLAMVSSRQEHEPQESSKRSNSEKKEEKKPQPSGVGAVQENEKAEMEVDEPAGVQQKRARATKPSDNAGKSRRPKTRRKAAGGTDPENDEQKKKAPTNSDKPDREQATKMEPQEKAMAGTGQATKKGTKKKQVTKKEAPSKPMTEDDKAARNATKKKQATKSDAPTKAMAEADQTKKNGTKKKSAKKPASAPIQTDDNNSETNETAELWGKRLQQAPSYLTKDGQSWFIHVKKWMPTPSEKSFEVEWNLHPTKRHTLIVYGREAEESRWSQSWGKNYAYSGNVSISRPLEESSVVPGLLERINSLMHDDDEGSQEKENPPYNGCLQNWYRPEDKIGLHADDERDLNQAYPIWSLSWGGSRRFLFRRKVSKKRPSPNPPEKPVEVLLEDGDLVLMGGTCQQTHKHEIPKLRKKDPPTSNRINWTIRAFK